ncbi:MAG: hypothetical protein ACKO6L_01115, partial [Flavobacteriales bacterium]
MRWTMLTQFLLRIKHIRLLLLLPFFLGLASMAKAQCTANAGNNVTICQGESVQLGGNPTAVNPNNANNVSYDWNNAGS